MKKNEFLIGFGLIVSFVFVVVLGILTSPVPHYTTEVKEYTSTVYEEGMNYIYRHTAVVRSDSKILAESQKLIRLEVPGQMSVPAEAPYTVDKAYQNIDGYLCLVITVTSHEDEMSWTYVRPVSSLGKIN